MFIEAQLIIDDPSTDPVMARVRFAHQTPDFTVVDVALAGGPPLFAGFDYGQVSPNYLELAPGTYDLEFSFIVYGPAVGQTTLASQIRPEVTLDAGVNYTVYLAGSPFGLPGLPYTLDLYTVVDSDERPRFRRGDANGDAGYDISDAIFTLSALFVPGALQPSCEDAADSNDDGGVDVSDAVFTLSALFVAGSPEPPAPALTDCGTDPSLDPLGCASYTICP